MNVKVKLMDVKIIKERCKIIKGRCRTHYQKMLNLTDVSTPGY
jgi:hypothetical protein